MLEVFVSKQAPYTQARSHTRVPADFTVVVKADGLRLADRARDISEGGLGVITSQPLQPMSMVALQLQLPNTEPLVIQSRVMWAANGQMGFRFEQHDVRLFESIDRMRRNLERI